MADERSTEALTRQLVEYLLPEEERHYQEDPRTDHIYLVCCELRDRLMRTVCFRCSERISVDDAYLWRVVRGEESRIVDVCEQCKEELEELEGIHNGGA